ncbi:MAG TPA: DUF1549 domain-containing protein, partial [Gemmatales bacterium]|nr:DUF1549 domain-containing protein [Gemmatales bacterium]
MFLPWLASSGLVAVCLLTWFLQPDPVEDKPTPAQVKHFEEQVFPLLEQSCFRCHGGEAKVKGGLNLTSRSGILEGGDTEAAINLKEPEKSLLLKAIQYEGGLQMPPTGKLTPAKIAILTEWVKAGAPWPDHIKYEAKKDHPVGGVVTAESKNYWAYRPVTVPPIPTVQNQSWVRTPIDAFILEKLEAQKLQPSVPADKRTLIRRATYDLTGLPPTPEEIDSFLNDTDPAAYEKRIDALLASPHYGEKWARHWLDVVRFAETN